jgi:hypothetical protein
MPQDDLGSNPLCVTKPCNQSNQEAAGLLRWRHHEDTKTISSPGSADFANPFKALLPSLGDTRIRISCRGSK